MTLFSIGLYLCIFVNRSDAQPLVEHEKCPIKRIKSCHRLRIPRFVAVQIQGQKVLQSHFVRITFRVMNVFVILVRLHCAKVNPITEHARFRALNVLKVEVLNILFMFTIVLTLIQVVFACAI